MQYKQHITDISGTMRLGAYPCRLGPGTQAAAIYGAPQVSERHRHRYEVNNKYREQFIEHGLNLSGLSPDGSLVEMVELQTHPWYIGCQFHPELQSRPTRPHPLFAGFIGAAAQAKSPTRTSRNSARPRRVLLMCSKSRHSSVARPICSKPPVRRANPSTSRKANGCSPKECAARCRKFAAE